MQQELENFLSRHNYWYWEHINIDNDWKKCAYCSIDITINYLFERDIKEYMADRFKKGDLQEVDKQVIKEELDKKYQKPITSKEGIEGIFEIHSCRWGSSYSDGWKLDYSVRLTKKTVQTICRNCNLIGNRNVKDIIKRTLKDFEKNVLELEIRDFARLCYINQNKGDCR